MNASVSSAAPCFGHGAVKSLPIALARLFGLRRTFDEVRAVVRESWLARVALAILAGGIVLVALRTLGVFEAFAACPVLRNVSGWVGPVAAVGAAAAGAVAAAGGAGAGFPGQGYPGEPRDGVSSPDGSAFGGGDPASPDGPWAPGKAPPFYNPHDKFPDGTYKYPPTLASPIDKGLIAFSKVMQFVDGEERIFQYDVLGGQNPDNDEIHPLD